MNDGDLAIKYRNEEQFINNKLDQELEKLLKTFGFKWTGSGISVQGHIRDISFKKI